MPVIRGLPIELGEARRCLVMGVLNVTPDSFSDGGLWFDSSAAVEHGLLMSQQGADLVDVGGESTRPGAARVPVAEECQRVLPVVAELAAAGLAVSVDTMRAEVAERAVAAGACLVNDVSGGLADPRMASVVAQAGVPFVVMHWRGHSVDMAERATYVDVVAEVVTELRERLDRLAEAGVDPSQCIVDPGLGFAKTAEHNWALLARLDALAQLGRPVLVGASRKSFLGALLAEPDGTPRSFPGRDVATSVLSAEAARAGAWCVRVHDVVGSVDAVRVAGALLAAGRGRAGPASAGSADGGAAGAEVAGG